MRASVRNITSAKKQDRAKTQSCFFIYFTRREKVILSYLLPLTFYLLPLTSYHIISNESADVIG